MPFSPLSNAFTLSNFLSLANEPTLNADLGSGQGGITISSFLSFFGISGVSVLGGSGVSIEDGLDSSTISSFLGL